MRGRRLASVALLACLALAACKADPVGPVDPDDTATPSATTSPTPAGPTPPTLPDAAEASTARGAIAFVGFYVSLMNFSAETGDTVALRSKSLNCSTCANYFATYERIKKAGGYSEDPGWVSVPTVSQRTGSGRFRVLTTIETKPFKFKVSTNSSIQSVGPKKYELIFDVATTDTGFKTTQIGEQVATD